jgi:hypothetical protein
MKLSGEPNRGRPILCLSADAPSWDGFQDIFKENPHGRMIIRNQNPEGRHEFVISAIE